MYDLLRVRLVIHNETKVTCSLAGKIGKLEVFVHCDRLPYR
jgi:hypothetical protein